MRAFISIFPRLEGYLLGLTPQKIDIPVIHLVRPDTAANKSNSPLLFHALKLFLKLKGAGKNKMFIRIAVRIVEYI